MSEQQECTAENDARRLSEEAFRHSWDMSDERLIDGVWVAGLCCECGDFVPYGQEIAHVAAALAPLIAAAKGEAWDEGYVAGSEDQINAYWGPDHDETPNPYRAALTAEPAPTEGEGA